MGVGKSYTMQLARPGGVGASSQFGHVLAYNFQALWHPWPPAKAELERDTRGQTFLAPLAFSKDRKNHDSIGAMSSFQPGKLFTFRVPG